MNTLFRNWLVALTITGLLVVGCTSMYLDPNAGRGGGGSGGSGSGGGSDDDFLNSGTTSSFFRAIQIDPKAEDSAGPQFVDVGDLDGDGRLDLVSGWNESQPVQIHLQRVAADGTISFQAWPLAGTSPIARIAGLEIADIDVDGNPDVVVLVKDTGEVATCDQTRPDCDVTQNGGVVDNAIMGVVVVLFAPDDPAADVWTPVELARSKLAGLEVDSPLPEEGGYTALAVGDLDQVNGPDIVVALNSAEGDPMLNSVDLYPNPGGVAARDTGQWTRNMIHWDLPAIKDIELLDVERDGDLDVVCTYPNSKSLNVRWIVNPLEVVASPDEILTEWGAPAPIGQVHTHADQLALGDVDGDGVTDVVVRTNEGKLVQWFKAPDFPSFDFIRNPWQVYTLAEFVSRAPGAVTLGDLDGDGKLDAAVGAEGALAWFHRSAAYSVYAQWTENLIIDDSPPDDSGGSDADADAGDLGALLDVLTDPGAAEESVTGTVINDVIIVDLDGDGANDIIATLDRNGLSGLTNDALVWFQSNR